MKQHVFLSYSRDDRPVAQVIAKALEQDGFNVWWDKDLKAGQTYDEVTEDHLRRSGAVIVLWSETSVKSRWVRAEATLGDRMSELVPAMIEDADRPIMFELTQAADLISWNGDRSEPRWTSFVADVRAALERSAAKVAAEESEPAPIPAPAPEPVAAAPVAEPPKPAPVAAAAPAASPASEEKSSGGKGGLLLGLLALALLGGGAFAAMQMGVFTPSADDIDAQEPEIIAEPICEICPELVTLPGGSFDMGSQGDEPGRTGNEGPVRTVTLAPFSISKTEVTFADWDACIEGGGCGGHTPRGPEEGRANLAVSRVSWQDAQAYAAWLSGETGETWRLPSEAEWEYAARGGTATAYWWGDRFDSSKVASDALTDLTTLPENPFGLIGTSGTIREWVQDCYNPNFDGAPTDGAAVLSGDCQQRVVRGGASGQANKELRSAARARVDRGLRDRRYGFRIVRED